MYTGWLIYSQKDANANQSYIAWFIEEAEKAGMQLQLIIREDLKIGISSQKRTTLLKGREVKFPDFAVVRTMEPILNAQLESLGTLVFNSSQISSICNNKAWTHHYVHHLGVPMADTYFYNREHLIESPLPFPFVMKEAEGRSGKQVYLIENDTDWNDAKRLLKQKNIIIQSANVQFGKDLRVFIVGKEIVGAVLRHNPNDFRANFKLGGNASLYPLQPKEEKLVREIIHHFEFGMVGIDFLIAKDGTLLFNEIEDVVGSRILSAVSDVNILEKYISFIKSKLNKFKNIG